MDVASVEPRLHGTTRDGAQQACARKINTMDYAYRNALNELSIAARRFHLNSHSTEAHESSIERSVEGSNLAMFGTPSGCSELGVYLSRDWRSVSAKG